MHKRGTHGILRGQSRWLFVLICSTAVPLLSDAGLAAPSLKTSSVAEAMEQLKPGEYLWTPEVAPEGQVVVIVSLKSQTDRKSVVEGKGVSVRVDHGGGRI